MSAKQLMRSKNSLARTEEQRILVWDAPVRVFHWLMVLAFAGAWLTGEEDAWRLLHVTLGYTMAGLVAFRIAWGVAGTRHARFTDFVRGPGAVLRYLRALLRGRPEHYAGHNPAGAVGILALLFLTVAVAASGWATEYRYGGDLMEEVHEVLASLMLALVALHVAAVLLSSWLHRENLIGAMISGRKKGAPDDGVPSARRAVAAILLLAVLGFWWYQWQAPAVLNLPADRAASRPTPDADDDDA